MPEKQREIPEKYMEYLRSQIKYYARASKKSRKEYLVMSTIPIILNAVVPVLAIGLETDGALKYIVAAFGAMATIFSSILALRQSKESWISFRSTASNLVSEIKLFETGSGKYMDGTEEDFIFNCEEIMKAAQKEWEKNLRESKLE